MRFLQLLTSIFKLYASKGANALELLIIEDILGGMLYCNAAPHPSAII